MPTRPRIDIAGYHHIMNRGVDQMNIFRHNEDKDMFLQIVNKTAMIHKVVVHDYCLMDNHYHLLIETQTDNLSRFMRFVSANYAKYFNNKTKRTGHLSCIVMSNTQIVTNQDMLALNDTFIH
jgi:REP element-mobilizing transposase RayT